MLNAHVAWLVVSLILLAPTLAAAESVELVQDDRSDSVVDSSASA